MGRVVGIGGIFFKVADPAALRAWYTRVLGIDVRAWGGAKFEPVQRGSSVWTPFAEDTQHFEPSTRDFMINLLVEDLDGLLAKVTAEGVAVLDRQSMDGMGRFAWIMDPAGIKVELWEPA